MSKLREVIGAKCGLPVALEVMGERWSFLILRASFNGICHFEEFLSVLGIARNILSNRLGRLVEHGILAREPQQNDRRKVAYRLTAKGTDLLPALIALRQWGERHGGCASNPVLVDSRDGVPIAQIRIQTADGRAIEYADLQWIDQAQGDQPGAPCTLLPEASDAPGN